MPAYVTAPIQGEAASGQLTPVAFDVAPAPLVANRKPHKSFLELMNGKAVQMHPTVPLIPNRRRLEGMFQCTKQSGGTGERCQCFAKANAELEHHASYGHDVPCKPAQPTVTPSHAFALDTLPGYHLGEAIPCNTRNKRTRQVEHEAEDEDDDEQLMA